MELTKDEFESMKAHRNMVLIKPDILSTKRVEMAGGLKLLLYTDFEKEKFSATSGEVIKVCTDRFFHKQGGIEISAMYDAEIEAQVGDRIYFHYTKMETSNNEGRIFLYEDEYYMWISYDSLYCGKRGDEILMFNGFVLLEPVEDKQIQSTIIKLPGRIRARKSTRYGRVAHVGEPCKAYYEEKDIIDDYINVEKGDVVLFEAHSDIPLQYSFLADLEDKKPFFRTQRKDFVAIAKSPIFDKQQ